MKEYKPELGQAIFGQPHNQFGVPDYVESAIKSIGQIMELNSIDGYTPFDNSGIRFKNDVFECNAYDWSECQCGFGWDGEVEKCTCGHVPQEYNFKWKDFEMSWYKYYGRGMSMNRKISKNELKQLVKECLISII